jgi:hypothetical protein
VKLTGRIPVEPLDEERLTRIERRIVAGAAEAAAAPARAPRSSPALAFAAAAVVALGAGVAGWKLRGAPAPVVAAAPVEVRTDEQRTTLDIGDARIHGDPATAFTLTRPAGGVLVAMTRGKVALEVGKRGDRPPLVVRAGDTEVVVVGTQFSVDYGDGTGDVDVRVTEGVVRVVRREQETRVAAGQAWTSRRGLVAIGDAGPGLAGAGARSRPPAQAGDAPAGATIADAGRRGSADIEIDMSKAPDVLRDRVAAVPDVRAPQPGAGASPQPGAGASPPRGAGSGSGGGGSSAEAAGRPHPLEPRGDLKALIRAQPVLPALDVGEPDAQKAMAAYRAIMTREKGPNEAHAFYSMAVIQALKLGRTGDALATLAAFRRRAPASEYFAAALWLEVRIRCLRGVDDECRQAAEVYLRHAPEGPARHVAEKIGLTR